MGPLLLLALLSAPAQAQETAVEAEQARLLEEMDKLAKKNAWSGVERDYGKAVALGEVSFAAHRMGAMAARSLGMALETAQRLKRALALQEDESLRADLANIEASFGRVRIEAEGSELIPDTMPFAPDQRAAIEYAQATLAESGSFKGMLPRGGYRVGTQAFTVEGGPDFLAVSPAPAVAEGKEPKPPREPRAPGDGSSAMRVGPLVMLGGGYAMTPPPPAGEDLTVLQPGATGWGSLQLTAGVELSLGMVGVALAASAAPGLGSSYLHQIGAWGALVVRPGPLHLAIGPSYQYAWGRGDGLAPWLDRGQDPAQDLSSVGWRGQVRAFGGRLEAGVGVLPVGPMELLVSLGGAVHHDGTRPYLGGALSVGLMPGRAP